MGETGGPRRGRAFHRAGGTVATRLSEAAARRGFAEPGILVRWGEIVGADLAGDCQPVKISYGRASPGLGATLLVRAAGARATEIEHRAPQIVQRVNAFYGYRAVSRLRLTQASGARGRARGFAEPAAPFAGKPAEPDGPPPEPDPDAQARAAAMVSGIRRPGLRDALARLGAAVLSGAKDQRKERTPG